MLFLTLSLSKSNQILSVVYAVVLDAQFLLLRIMKDLKDKFQRIQITWVLCDSQFKDDLLCHSVNQGSCNLIERVTLHLGTSHTSHAYSRS